MNRPSPDEAPAFTIGVLADTHIPDGVIELHPMVLPMLRETGAVHILHAGDISVQRVLDTLREAAPVTAVRGNRDFFAGPLHMVERIELGGVSIALMHGHGGWLTYLWDKWKFLLSGYQLERYLKRLMRIAGQADVIVFGHTHFPEIILHGGQMLFNPGSASFGRDSSHPPTLGLLHIYSDGQVQAKIVPLRGYEIRGRQWQSV